MKWYPVQRTNKEVRSWNPKRLFFLHDNETLALSVLFYNLINSTTLLYHPAATLSDSLESQTLFSLHIYLLNMTDWIRGGKIWQTRNAFSKCVKISVIWNRPILGIADNPIVSSSIITSSREVKDHTRTFIYSFYLFHYNKWIEWLPTLTL